MHTKIEDIPLFAALETRFPDKGLVSYRKVLGYFLAGMALSDRSNGWKYQSTFWMPFQVAFPQAILLRHKPQIDIKYIKDDAVPLLVGKEIAQCRSESGKFDSGNQFQGPIIRIADEEFYNSTRAKVLAADTSYLDDLFQALRR